MNLLQAKVTFPHKWLSFRLSLFCHIYGGNIWIKFFHQCSKSWNDQWIMLRNHSTLRWPDFKLILNLQLKAWFIPTLSYIIQKKDSLNMSFHHPFLFPYRSNCYDRSTFRGDIKFLDSSGWWTIDPNSYHCLPLMRSSASSDGNVWVICTFIPYL